MANSHETFTIHDGLAVYRFGKGRPVFLMPGPHRLQQPGDGSALPLLRGIVSRGCQVLSFDPPGSGLSKRVARISLDEILGCADEALDSCPVRDRIPFVGHSMGGLALIAYTIERPSRVGSLALIGTGSGGRAYMEAPGALWNNTHPGFRKLALLGTLQNVSPALAPQRILLNFVRAASFQDQTYFNRQPIGFLDWFRPKNARLDWRRIARRLDYSHRLKEISVPTLVACGRHDPQFPPSCSEELASEIRGSRMLWFERSGHYPFIEEEAEFWREVGAFLTDKT
jgi:proline iminopeptidase